MKIAPTPAGFLKVSVHVLFNEWERHRGQHIVSVGFPNPNDPWGMNARNNRTHYKTEKAAIRAAREVARAYGVTALGRNGEPLN